MSPIVMQTAAFDFTPSTVATFSPARTQDDELIVGESDAMRYVMFRVDQVAPTDATRAALRRDRHRQGAARARDSPAQPAAQPPVRRRQLRGDAGDAHRERAVRPRARRVHRRAHVARSAASSWPTAARSSSTRSASCRSKCSRSCCASCRKARSNGSAARARSTSTCGSSPRPTATWPRKCGRAGSAAICTTG